MSDWVCQYPSERQRHLPHLLPLLKLSALPEEQLSQQQLQACSGPQAVCLAQQLHRAAQACQHVHPHQHQCQWQQMQGLTAQQQASRRQAGPPMADPSVAGQCLGGSSDGSAVTAGDRVVHAADIHPHLMSASPGDGSSSQPPAWWGPEAMFPDANNHSAGGVSSGSSRDVLLACSNNAAVPGSTSAAVMSSSSSGGVQSEVLLGLCEPGHIGAVVAQAWPGRQRGHQPTTILVAGVLVLKQSAA